MRYVLTFCCAILAFSVAAQEKEEGKTEEAVEVQFDIPVESTTEVVADENKIHSVFTVDVRPEYSEGHEAKMAFIKKNLIYPKNTRKESVERTVYVEFVVNQDGTLTDIHPLRAVSPDLDQEAVRVIAIMPKWNPGLIAGKAVKVRNVVPLTFGIEKK